MSIKENALVSLLCNIAPYTFGIYLLHENNAIRDFWQQWVGVEKVRDSFLFIPQMLLAVLTIFIFGIIIDFARKKIFCFVFRNIDKLEPK